MWRLIVLIYLSSYATSEKIIIIGSGAAGIAAASKLLENNISDFRILEAEDRIGGRINSFHLGSAVVDLGAQYVHGEEGNIVYELAKNFLRPGRERNSSYVYYSGQLRTGDNLLFASEAVYNEAWSSAYNSSISIGEAFLKRYNETILAKYENNSEFLNYAKSMIRTDQCLINSLEGCFDWFNCAAISNFLQAKGDQTLSWNGLGYKTIFDIMLRNFPNKTGFNINNKISLKKTVSKVILNEKFVNVKCKDGSEYTSEYVLFTPSLGVLKNEHENMFLPKLSQEKVNAMENLGFDGVMKVIMEFPNNWWGIEENLVFVWTEKERMDLPKTFPHGPIKNGDHWLSWFSFIGVAPNNPNVLIGWIVGPLLPEIEKLTESEITNGTMFVIRKFLGNKFTITDPINVIHSTWYSNPNFRGTYSYEKAEKKHLNITSPHSVLLQPITGNDGIPRILFAGEATHPTRFSTVDGAVGSGFREGNRLVKILLKGTERR